MTLHELLESPALALLLDMERDGLQTEATDADTIRVSPASRLDADRLTRVRQHKLALLQLLRLCDSDVQARVDSYRKQLAAAPADGIPMFVFRDDVPYRAGACFSCGTGLPPAETRTVQCATTDGITMTAKLRECYGRCWRCLLAFRLAVGAELPASIAQARTEAKLVS